MVSRSGLRAAAGGGGLLACGVMVAWAWRDGLWGLLTGALLAAIWLCALHWRAVARPRPEPGFVAAAAGDAAAHRLLLDAAPTPMLGIEGETVRALNRAARRQFGTDDRVRPVPAGLSDRDARHVRHEGRSWRVDRVMLAGGDGNRMVAALIDIEQEERAAEARAMAALIHVLGHELLNGLAPIASLAESGLAAVEGANGDPALLREILATLARRAEGLQRFAEGYRALARLPEPSSRPVVVREMVDDLARLFAGRWPALALSVTADGDAAWPLDRDQVSQALWALLQNAAEAVADRGSDARVTLAASSDDRALVIEVRDNGSGIAPADAVRIFRPFHTTKPDGTGIGLSLARQIAHAHGGMLVLAPGRDTIFRLTLPA